MNALVKNSGFRLSQKKAFTIALLAGEIVFKNQSQRILEDMDLSERESLFAQTMIEGLTHIRNGNVNEVLSLEVIAQNKALVRGVTHDNLIIFAPDDEMVQTLESYYSEELEKLTE